MSTRSFGSQFHHIRWGGKCCLLYFFSRDIFENYLNWLLVLSILRKWETWEQNSTILNLFWWNFGKLGGIPLKIVWDNDANGAWWGKITM